MKKKLLNKDEYAPMCKICKHGRLSPEGDSILCIKKGIVDPEDKCRHYAYDPLKRKPRRQAKIDYANPFDFEL